MYATIDIETTGLNRYKDDVTYIGIGLAHEIGEDFFKEYLLDMRKPEAVETFINVCYKLKGKKAKVVWQNGKFDTLFIELKYGIKLPISEDIMLMGTAYDLAEEHGLKKMARRYLGVEDWDIAKKDKLGNGDDKILKKYLRKDYTYTWKLFCFFSSKMTEQQFKIYRKLLKPAFLMYRDVERTGIYFDRKTYKEVKKKYQSIEDEKLNELKSHYDINWNSSKQKAEVLYTKKGENLPVLKRSEKTGEPSSDASTMKKLASKGFEIPQLMLDYAAANTLNKMFLKRWGDDSSYDGRIHPSFNLTNVVSGRTSCTDPNLQQVPRTSDVRGLFNATDGNSFFEADYSQLELRIAAHFANEPTMLRIYREGGDIHTETAKLVTGGREPDKDERRRAKAVNFGFLYGMGAKKFVEYAFDSYGVVFSQTEAERFREAYFAKYSRLLPWHEEQKQLCQALGGVPNLFGRFRNLPGIYANNYKDRGYAERCSINTPVQGTGSDILLSAAIEIHRELSPYGLKIVGTVHDSILGEFPTEYTDWFVERIRAIMLHPKLLDSFGVKLKVPLDCDIGVGPWGTH